MIKFLLNVHLNKRLNKKMEIIWCTNRYTKSKINWNKIFLNKTFKIKIINLSKKSKKENLIKESSLP